MNYCIKCGIEIPDGELFCLECSLNPGSTLFNEHPAPPRQSAPTGRMQTPQPTKSTRQASQAAAAVAVAPQKKASKRPGLVAALILVCVMLAGLLGFNVWQYNDIRVQRTRLETKEADLLLREKEKEDMELELESLQQQLQSVQTALGEKDSEINDLKKELSGSQSSQSQSEYDLSNALAQMSRIEEENKALLLLEEELEETIQSLTDELAESTAALEEEKENAEKYKTKAEFMDKYVVFVENNNSKVYHTYDCEKFTRSNFWAYSRKLAESNGFGPCSVCGGKP